jgi:hypothetical protein
MPNYQQEDVDRVVEAENRAIEQNQNQALIQYLQNRVVALGVETQALRNLLQEHAPEALAEFDAPPPSQPAQPQDHLPPSKPRAPRKPRKPKDDDVVSGEVVDSE